MAREVNERSKWSSLLENAHLEAQTKEKNLSLFNLEDEGLQEIERAKKGDNDLDSVELREGIHRIAMATNLDRQEPPLIPPINPLVRPSDLFIFVLQNLDVLDLLPNLSKFLGTKDEEPFSHIENCIERLASSLITNPSY